MRRYRPRQSQVPCCCSCVEHAAGVPTITFCSHFYRCPESTGTIRVFPSEASHLAKLSELLQSSSFRKGLYSFWAGHAARWKNLLLLRLLHPFYCLRAFTAIGSLETIKRGAKRAERLRKIINLQIHSLHPTCFSKNFLFFLSKSYLYNG